MKRIELDRIPENKPGRSSRHFSGNIFSNKVIITLQSLSVIKHYLAGTDSSEWLNVAEDNIYKRMKGAINGNKNRG